MGLDNLNKRIGDKVFHVVQDGLQIMPKRGLEWETVSDAQAVMIDENVFCTQRWFDAYKRKGLDSIVV